MMPARYDVMSGRKYTAKDGTEKTSWSRVGVAFQARDGVSLNVQLDAIPLDGRLYITPPRERSERAPREEPPPSDGHDELPF